MQEFTKEVHGETELTGWILHKEDTSHKIWQLTTSDLDVQCQALDQNLLRKKQETNFYKK